MSGKKIDAAADELASKAAQRREIRLQKMIRDMIIDGTVTIPLEPENDGMRAPWYELTAQGKAALAIEIKITLRTTSSQSQIVDRAIDTVMAAFAEEARAASKPRFPKSDWKPKNYLAGEVDYDVAVINQAGEHSMRFRIIRDASEATTKPSAPNTPSSSPAEQSPIMDLAAK